MIAKNKQFNKQMQELLGTEYDAYIKALAMPPVKALRINSLKSNEQILKKYFPSLQKSKPFGYAYNERNAGAHFTHHAGHFYMQDPSAMAVVNAFKPYIGKRILDLCAAPGGKCSQLAEFADKDAIIIANDPEFLRVKTLEYNLCRLGIKNAVVTNNHAEDFLQGFSGYFDTILVDAPCSGEGMMRKERVNWSEGIVRSCSLRQKEILRCVAALIKPKGYLMYSTCTFNTQENECVVQEIADLCGFDIIQTQLLEGAVKGLMGVEQAQRLYPHKVWGEGQFFCLMQKNSQSYEIDVKYKAYKNPNNEMLPLKAAEINGALKTLDNIAELDLTNAVRFKDSVNILDSGRFPDLKTLNVISAGANILNDNIPSHALAMNIDYDKINKRIDFSGNDKAVERYLRGEQLNIDAGFDGFGIITADKIPLGLVRSVKLDDERVLKNFYPKAARNR